MFYHGHLSIGTRTQPLDVRVDENRRTQPLDVRRWWESNHRPDLHKERAENIGVYIFTTDSASNLARGY